MGTCRKTRTTMWLTAAAMCLATSPALANITLSAGNASVVIETGNPNGVTTFTIDGVDQIARQWFWFRPTPTAPEQSISSLTLTSEASLGNFGIVNYSSGGISVQITFVLIGGSPGSGTADLAEHVVVTRSSGLAGLSFFQYADFDLAGTPTDDTVTFPGDNLVVQSDGAGSFVLETSEVPIPTAHEGGTSTSILNKLNDGVATNLINNASFGPGNVAWAFQWSPQTGTSIVIGKDLNLHVMPARITCPSDIEIECGDPTDPSFTGTPMVSSSCVTTDVTYSDVRTPANCTGQQGIERTWTVTDNCGPPVSCVQLITFVDNTPPIITCPTDVQLTCTDSADPTNTGSATATDNCGGIVVISYTDAEGTPNCSGRGDIVRTWKATDSCGNFSTCEQNLRFIDNTPPEITCPPDKELACGDSSDPSNTGSASAIDICGGQVAIEYSDAPTAAGCAGVPGIDRTWKATDACGNFSTCVQHITYVDTTPPVIACPADKQLHCGDPSDMDHTGNATATDNCGGAVSITFSDEPTAAGCAGVAGIDRTWKATDACGNEATCVQHLTYIDTTPPSISCPADADLACGDSNEPSATGSASATDNCGGSVNITYTDAAVAAGCAGVAGIDRTWKATDACGNEATCVQHIRYVDTTLPIITCPADVELACGESSEPATTGSATATDNCNGTVNITYTDAATTAGCAGVAGIDRTWKATDACGNEATCVQHITIIDVTNPEITCPADTQIVCGQSTDPANTGSATATDDCGGSATITYSDVTSSAGCTGSGGIERTWKAVDACGNEATCVQQITLIDSTPPVIACPSDRQLTCGDSTEPSNTGSATATDNCGGTVTITYSDVSDGAGCTGSGGIERTWKAVDACGNESTCVQHITLIDTTPPTISCPADKQLQCGESTDPANTGSATGTDNCGGTVSINYTDAAAAASCTGMPGIVRTWKATDACGNEVTCEQQISFVDTTLPIITCPADKELQCGDSTDPSSTGSATATDNCGGTVTVTYTDAAGSGTCAGAGIARTWKAVDACGNEATCVQRISYVDTTPPTVACPANVARCTDPGRCDAVVNYDCPTATDNCDGAVTVTCNPPSGGTFPQGVTTVTVTATDACNNQKVCTFTVTINDCAPPDITCPADKQLACGESTAPSNTGTATAVDNCGGAVTITYTDAATAAGCAGKLGIARTWKAVDSKGNFSTCVQQITFVDTTPPVITCPAEKVISCGASSEPAATGTASAIDNCGGAVVIEYEDAPGPDEGCTGEAGIDRTWKATDACGNMAICVQRIVFTDTIKPVITCPPSVAIECDDPTDPTFTGEATATDNCGEPTVTYTDSPLAANCTGKPGIKRTWKATDDCGNYNTCVQNITYVDVTPPTIVCPGNITTCKDAGKSYATVYFTLPTITDDCGGPVTVTACPPSGTRFYGGNTTVVVTAKDGCNNETTCSFVVTVNSCTAPTICCPCNITVTKDPGQCCAVVNFNPSASGGVPPLTIISNPPSGTCFPVGTTTVSSYVRDSQGRQSATCTFTVKVLGTICGTVWFDTECDGARDSNDNGLGGIKVQLKTTGSNPCVVATKYTSSNGSYCFSVAAGTYNVVVVKPSNYSNSTASQVNKTISASTCEATVNFGLCCNTAMTGGYTPGFWSNNNGKSKLQANDPAWRTLLNGLCIRNVNGSRFTIPTNCSFNTAYSTFRSWLIGSNATNMAYKLSQHLAATKLNVAFKGLNANASIVLTSSMAACYGSPTATISAVMAQADAALCADGNTPSGDPNRAYQECLKNILDAVNNNQLPRANPTPCNFCSPY